MAKLILMRHGESMWNLQNLFTGWVDVPLSDSGVQEAIEGGKKIADLQIDIAFTSTLIRAQETLTIALREHHGKKTPIFIHNRENEPQFAGWSTIHNTKILQSSIPVYTAWQLNERMYGDLQGLNKAETIAKYGAEQVHIWRRSYDIPPPNGESLQQCARRTIPFFETHILPKIIKGENVLIVAHGNSLRSIIMKLENLSKEQVLNLELPTGKPQLFTYANNNFTRI